MATVNHELDKRYKSSKRNDYALQIKIIHDRKVKRYPTYYRFSDDEWMQLKKSRIRDAKLRSIKTELDNQLNQIQNIIDELGKNFTFKQFERIHFGVISGDEEEEQYIEYYFRITIDQLRKEHRYGTADSYKSAMSSVLKYKPELLCRQITPDFLYKYEEWMLARGRSISTVSIHVKAVRVMINLAIEKKIMSRNDYPFGPKTKKKYDIPRVRNVKKALTPSMIKAILNFKCADDEILFSSDMGIQPLLRRDECGGHIYPEI